MSCTDIRTQIDRQPKISADEADGGLDHTIVQIRAHAQSCGQCAEYLDNTEQVEQLLMSLPEIEPGAGLSSRVMKRLTEQRFEQPPSPRPRPAFVSLLVQQLLRNVSFLLACAGLLAGSSAELLARRLGGITLSPALVSSRPTAILLAFACLLLLLSLKAGTVRWSGDSRNH